ncbi:hypothetical protein SEA_FEDE_11 [Microbacterium phage Fede]|nr:hypothetical protein SEA_FEDE_11 [Microbacterium phage Fede]
MSNNTDPRYRSGNFDEDSREIVLFFLGENEKPSAMYVGCNGEYDAFYDLDANIVGSPLSDIIEATPEDIDYLKVAAELQENGDWNEPTLVSLPSMFAVDPWSGLSINMVQESAFTWLASQVYSRWYDDTDTRTKIARELGEHA